ncbi:PQQ-dependent sugar dehydrogenase [Algisphaera agarilytica]|uniref:Glucose/arabinose dehydrogenase n=1 Tax=Algisphaera agarilytica TaxID=1385975 RepID=A0A7X0LLR0_9BACT|nr:PQQ-dependent sugar dehydrogenase [Algisphaera agarilytica]MBB6430233.1 glucose/arabinose dehydrogenase [Algisphaera agarilytica]
MLTPPSFSPRRLSLLSTALLSTVTLGSAPAQNVEELFKNNCIACHGENYAGGSASSMLNDDWVTDGSDRELFNAIYKGIEDAGMPAFEGGLTEAQSWALVVYLREARDEKRREALGDSKPDGQGVFATQHHSYKVETVAEGLVRPWSIEFLPDGTMLVSERNGELRLIIDDKLVKQPVVGTPKVWNHGQGGLLDIAVDPNYDTPGHPGNGWIYLSYSEITDDSGDKPAGMTAVVRGKLEKRGSRWVWTNQETLFETPAEHASPGRVHYGSRFVFDDDNTLFFTIGDRGQMPRSQELDRPNGKVHRIHTDGSIPEDNPFLSDSNAMPSVWSYGHRNPQGLAKHPVTGLLYDIEHGPRGGDEINLVEPGNNYGWPVVSYSMNYNRTPFGKNPPFHEDKGFVEPVYYWLPSIAQCGSSFYVGDGFPNWQNDLFVAALAKEEIRRVRLSEDGKTVIEDEPIYRGQGRIRDVMPGPDGALYVAVENRGDPGFIRRLVPVD